MSFGLNLQSYQSQYSFFLSFLIYVFILLFLFCVLRQAILFYHPLMVTQRLEHASFVCPCLILVWHFDPGSAVILAYQNSVCPLSTYMLLLSCILFHCIFQFQGIINLDLFSQHEFVFSETCYFNTYFFFLISDLPSGIIILLPIKYLQYLFQCGSDNDKFSCLSKNLFMVTLFFELCFHLE